MVKDVGLVAGGGLNPHARYFVSDRHLMQAKKVQYLSARVLMEIADLRVALGVEQIQHLSGDVSVVGCPQVTV